MFNRINSMWKAFKYMTVFDDHKPLSNIHSNSVNKPNILTSNIHDTKVPAEEKRFTTVKLKVNSLSNILDTRTQDMYTMLSYMHPLWTKVYNQELYSLGRSTNVVSQFSLIQSVCAQSDDINDSKSWKDLVIDGPCSYSKMETPFNNVLFEYKMNTQQLLKNLQHDDWELKLEHVGSIDAHQCCVKNNITGKYKLFDNCKPHFKIGEENDFGVISIINEHLSNDSGLRLNIGELGNAINSLYTSFQYKHPAVVLDAKFQCTQHNEHRNTVLNAELSGVFGYRFNHFGLLAGFSLVKTISSHEHLSWTNICQDVSIALVSSNNAMRFTLQPNSDMCTLSIYSKLNNILELATRHKGNWTSQETHIEDHDIGLKFKYSENLRYGIKSNLVGDITIGAWYNTEVFKMGLCTYFNFRNRFEEVGRNIGISIEF